MEKHTEIYNDWEYELSNKNGSLIPKLNVKPNKPQKKLESLSKYYSLNKNNVLAFLNNEFYVSQPDQLNDLFDSSLSLINFENKTFEQFIEFITSTNRDIKQEEIIYYKNPTEYLQRIKHDMYQGYLSSVGILCMTNENENELMWAHYTNNEGFLIEYDYSMFNSIYFKGPYPINYTKNLIPVDFNKLNYPLGLTIAFTIKKDIWLYENEYRFLCISKDEKGYKVSGKFDNSKFHSKLQRRFIDYPKESVKKVILASAFYKKDNTTYPNYKYDISFTGKDATLKILLFNNIIENRIDVELIIFDEITFELKPMPINITKRNETTYHIEEQRPKVKTK